MQRWCWYALSHLLPGRPVPAAQPLDADRFAGLCHAPGQGSVYGRWGGDLGERWRIYLRYRRSHGQGK